MKYLRKKGRWKNGESKYIIEENGKYVETVPAVERLVELIRQDSLSAKPSQKQPINEEKQIQKGGYYLLNAPSEKPENRTVSEEELQKLWELTK